ncbi:MAG: recombinase family protein, partial [Prevotella sp.]|nr:recombinase family protein [Prevotella sp.]
MGKRKQPFGYRMEAGRPVADPMEAATVMGIFRDYLTGLAYSEIAADLNTRTVRFYPDKAWSDNMVGRIVKDTRYTGEKGYPALIDEETMERASRIRASKTVQRSCSKAEKALRRMLGGTLPNHASDSVAGLLNQLIANPERIQAPPASDSQSHRVEMLMADLREKLEQEETDVESATAQVREIAAMQYEQIGKGEYETARLRRVLGQAEPMRELDEEILGS